MIPGVGLLSPFVPSYEAGDPYPLAGFRFKVEIKGVVQAHFSSVSGLSVETEVVPFQQGGNNSFVHQLKGQTKYSNIVLKRGVTDSAEFFEWIRKSINQETDSPPRVNGSIVVFDDDGTTPKVTWEFVRAWPCKFEGPSLDTGSSKALVETLELAHEGLTLK
jgi:phage tail-like protein